MEIQKFLFDLFSKQKFSECLEQSRISLIKNPNCIISREFEAVSLLKLNKIQESKKAFLEILKINKNIYSAHLNLARIFSQEGNYKIADQFYKNALIIQKNNCDLMLEQARFYKKFNFSNHAKNALFKINELNKNLPLVYFEIADIYYQEQNYERALTNYKLADNLLPDDAVVLNSIASCFFNLDQIGQAEKFYTKALAIKPDLILTLSNLAYFYQSKGDFDKALNFLNKILEIDPNNTEAYRYLSLQHKFENKTDPVLIKMVKIYQDLVNLNEKMTIGFALSKAYEDLYMYEESSLYLKSSNEIRRSFFKGYTKDLESKSFNYLKKSFTYNFCNKFKKDSFEQSKMPIFILGMPRSGTSLVEQILSSHKLVQGGGELNILNNSLNKFFNYSSTKDLCNQLLKASNQELKKIGEDYIFEIKKINNNKPFLTDKLPVNFQFIGLISVILPNAKIIHVYRNAKDNCFSIYKNYFAHNVMPWSYNETELVSYYENYKILMHHFNNILPNKLFHLKYEDLIANIENKIQSVLDFCDLEWDQNCLNFKDNKREVKTASIAQVRKGLYSSSVNSWKNFEPYFPKLFSDLKDFEL